MSAENANLVHAIAVFTNANPPVVAAGSVGVSAVVRGGAGAYEVQLQNKVVPLDGAVTACLSPNATAAIATAELGADGNVDVTAKSAVNTAADGGTLTVVVYRLPTRD